MMKPQPKSNARILLTRELDYAREVTPLALSFSLKDGHRFTYYDHVDGVQKTVPLEGCSFPLEADLRPEALQVVDASTEATPEVEGQE